MIEIAQINSRTTEYIIEVYEECMSVWLEHFATQSSKDEAVAKLQQFRELNPQLTYRLAIDNISELGKVCLNE